MTSASKRDRLIDAAASLFHERGLSCTSLADIAARAGIPIGNVYYYFKTKDELAICSLEKRKELMERTYSMINQSIADPRARLIEMLDLFDGMKAEYAGKGCPVGRLIIEASDMSGRIMPVAVSIFDGFIDWSAAQFRLLGHLGDARRFAVSLLGGIQGAAVLARSCGSSAPLADEIARMKSWIESLPNNNVRFGKLAAVSGGVNSA